MPLGEVMLTSEVTRNAFPDILNCEMTHMRNEVNEALNKAALWGRVEKLGGNCRTGISWRRLK